MTTPQENEYYYEAYKQEAIHREARNNENAYKAKVEKLAQQAANKDGQQQTVKIHRLDVWNRLTELMKFSHYSNGSNPKSDWQKGAISANGTHYFLMKGKEQ